MDDLYVYDRDHNILCTVGEVHAYSNHSRYPVLKKLAFNVKQHGSSWMLSHVTVAWNEILQNVGTGYFMMMDMENAIRFSPDRLNFSTNALLFMVRTLHQSGVADIGYKYGDELIFNSDDITTLRDTPDQLEYGIRYHRSAVSNPKQYDTKELLEHNAFAKTFSKKYYCMMVY